MRGLEPQWCRLGRLRWRRVAAVGGEWWREGAGWWAWMGVGVVWGGGGDDGGRRLGRWAEKGGRHGGSGRMCWRR